MPNPAWVITYTNHFIDHYYVKKGVIYARNEYPSSFTEIAQPNQQLCFIIPYSTHKEKDEDGNFLLSTHRTRNASNNYNNTYIEGD